MMQHEGKDKHKRRDLNVYNPLGFMTRRARKLVDLEAVKSGGAWLAFREIGLINNSIF